MGAKSRARPRSFIVRASRDASGEIRGIVELASTGAKETFTSTDAVGRVIARMLHDLTETDKPGPA